MKKFGVKSGNQKYYFRWDKDHYPEEKSGDYYILSCAIDYLKHSQRSLDAAQVLLSQINAEEIKDPV